MNTASGGNSDRVIDRLSNEDKEQWGAWRYLRGALPLVADLTAYDTSVQLDDGPKQRFPL